MVGMLYNALWGSFIHYWLISPTTALCIVPCLYYFLLMSSPVLSFIAIPSFSHVTSLIPITVFIPIPQLITILSFRPVSTSISPQSLALKYGIYIYIQPSN